jgi:hypothetical protein
MYYLYDQEISWEHIGETLEYINQVYKYISTFDDGVEL